MRPVIIGVAGGSGSGKTTVVQEIVRELGPDRVSVIQHDSYYRDRSGMSLAERAAVNYDHPDALDTALLVEHVRALLSGGAVRVPVYDFSTHTRKAETVAVTPRRAVILEGMGIEERNYSEQTAQAIDAEVRAILDARPARAWTILESRRNVLERLAERLIETETLDRAAIDALVAEPVAAPR